MQLRLVVVVLDGLVTHKVAVTAGLVEIHLLVQSQ
jgi:hypothetical protein